MALGDQRRRMRIQALETAAQYISSMENGGATPDELVKDVQDYDIYVEECEKLGKKLELMAEKLREQGVS